jgi:carboxyl-terminal processing protease
VSFTRIASRALGAAAVVLAAAPRLAAAVQISADVQRPADVQAASPSSRERLEDFDAFRRAIETSYAYPGDLGAWKARIAMLRERAARAANDDDFIQVLEDAIDLLHDDHVTLSRRSRRSPRRVPEEADVWARFEGGAARIEAVRVASDADVAGLQPGQAVARIQGVAIERAVAARLGGTEASPAARDWALRHLLAGPRQGEFRVELAPGERTVRIEHRAVASAEPAALARRIGESRDIGYLRLRFGAEPGVALQLDQGLAALEGHRALILDLRATDGPETGPEMRAVLARFAAAPGVWQVRVARDGHRVEDRVVPALERAARRPLVILVDRWTAGAAEALAIGLRAVAHATLIGTPMAGLRGVLHSARLPHSGVLVRYPGERAHAPDGTPRERAMPDVPVDLSAPSGGPGDPILYQALKRLEQP